jgi:hypothetical protein
MPPINSNEVSFEDPFLRKSISNGHAKEQAMIRRWWHTTHGARGRIVWEYYFKSAWPDAIWFPNDACVGVEEDGQQAAVLFPIRGAEVVLCEAKMKLTSQLIGQAAVYTWVLKQAGAHVRETVIFAQADPSAIRGAAESLGFTVVVP